MIILKSQESRSLKKKLFSLLCVKNKNRHAVTAAGVPPQTKKTYEQKCREKEEADQNVNRNANTNNTKHIEKVR